MKNKLLTGGILIGVLLAVYFLVINNTDTDTSQLYTAVKKGKFEVRVETTGELEAKNSVKIKGPSSLQNFGIWNITIQEIVEEGKIVEKGEFVAKLDPSELMSKIEDARTKLEQEESQYIQTKLDTALQLRESRDKLINLKYGVEEQNIKLEQSQYEPPATIRQVKIDLAKAKRAHSQAKENYSIKLQQNVAKMREAAAKLSKAKRRLEAMNEVLQAFTITAPEPGMLIYKKGYDGRPIKSGSQIRTWNPIVATLPDLSIMMSKTFVNEVDVRKVKKGQVVDIGLDAFPDKRLQGKVINVANVGEQKPNSDAKVFQVDVELTGKDELLKPAMTTSNSILTNAMEEVLYLPLESLHNYNDTVTYVYKKDGLNIIKQEVKTGETNSDEVILLGGLKAGDKVYLSVPSGMENQDIALLKELNGKRYQPMQDAPQAKVVTDRNNANATISQ